MTAPRVLGFSLAALMLLVGPPRASAQAYNDGDNSDPPDRVAQLDYESGDVQFAPAGVDDWGSAYRNRPLGTGDRLYTGDDGRAALELGDASVRLDAGTAMNLLDLDSQTAQFELSQGAMNLRVRWLDRGQTYEVDTPTLAFVVSEPGSYRIDAGRDGTQITVFSGTGVAYGASGDSRNMRAGRSYLFNGDSLEDASTMPLPRRDAFDRFCDDRDYRYDHSISRRYVSADMIGYDDLDEYGNWSYASDYGAVWYPRDVSYGWAPYRDGRWEWIAPWGWTWVDDSPWGFAPCHYGRWAFIGNRWGWIPGGTSRGAVYAPALVAFIGAIAFGSDQPVGWFPLGPRDIYQPWYHVSRNYFTSVNVTNVRVVNQTIINNYYNSYVSNTTLVNPPHYANRSVAGAVTVVPRNVFTGARPVAAAVLSVQPRMLEQAKVAPALRIAPSMASVGLIRAATTRGVRAAPSAVFARSVVARRTPPPAPTPLAQRLNLVAHQDGKPLAIGQLRDLRHADAQSSPQPSRIRIAGSNDANAVARQPMPAQPRALPPVSRPADRTNEQPLRAGELPSARYAHQQPSASGEPAPQPRDNGMPQAQGSSGYPRDQRDQSGRYRDAQSSSTQEQPQPMQRIQERAPREAPVQTGDDDSSYARQPIRSQPRPVAQPQPAEQPAQRDIQDRQPRPSYIPQTQRAEPRAQPVSQRPIAQPRAVERPAKEESHEDHKDKHHDKDQQSQDPQH